MTFQTFKLANIYADTLKIIYSITILENGQIRVEGAK